MDYDIRIDEYGDKFYYVNKILHREEGPAIEFANGNKHWYKNGKLHREDGPAVENSYKKEWWLNGVLHRDDEPAIEYASGAKYYYLNGKVHREDGPAIVFPDGYKKWYLKGKSYGSNNKFTNESWTRFVKTLIFS